MIEKALHWHDRASFCSAIRLALILVIAAFAASDGFGAPRPGEAPEGVGIDQRLGAELPLALQFKDEEGDVVRLGNFFHGRPVIIAPVYYGCPNLCNFTLNSLMESLGHLHFVAGEQYEVVVLSIDPNERPKLAKAKKANYMRRLGRPDGVSGFHFLTGQKQEIDELAAALGFRYRYDAEKKQYYHASAIAVASPDGRIARYLYGLEFPPSDLRLALVESADDKIGTPVDQFLLLCYHYDPTIGKYGVTVMNVLRFSGLASVVLLGGLIVTLSTRRSKEGDKETGRGSSMTLLGDEPR